MERTNLITENIRSLIPLVCEQPRPEPPVVPTPSDPLPPKPWPAELPPDILPVPKLPDERARHALRGINHVKRQ
jgi:hypothetical protein